VVELARYGNLGDFLRNRRSRVVSSLGHLSASLPPSAEKSVAQEIAITMGCDSESSDSDEDSKILTIKDLVSFACHIARGMDSST